MKMGGTFKERRVEGPCSYVQNMPMASWTFVCSWAPKSVCVCGDEGSRSMYVGMAVSPRGGSQ